MKVLIVGPSSTKSRGGMATVIKEIEEDKYLHNQFEIDSFESYIDGNILKRLVYSAIAYLKFYLFKRNYDIYHIHAASWGSTFRKGYYVRAAKKWEKKVILHIHGAEYMKFYEESNEKQKKKIVDILKSADMVIALSDDWKEKFESIFGLKNCVSLPNGIDTDAFSDAIIEPGEHKNEFVLLGRLGKRKGAYDLVNAVEIAVRTNPQIKVYMAGDGEVDKVKEEVRQKHLEDNIEVVGWIDFDGKKELLKKSATLVLPSYNEGLPMSVLEGMASGKAIISTTVGAIPEVVKEENGILIEPGDVNALADALVKCSSDLQMSERMSKNNIRKIDEEFSMRIMHKRLLEYYNNVISK